MKRVYITPFIANDYLTRDVYPEAQNAGFCMVPDAVFTDMLSDADYQANDCDESPAGCKRAYRVHLRKLEAKR